MRKEESNTNDHINDENKQEEFKIDNKEEEKSSQESKKDSKEDYELYKSEVDSLELSKLKAKLAELKSEKKIEFKSLSYTAPKILIILFVVVISVLLLKASMNYITTTEITVIGHSMEPTLEDNQKIKIKMISKDDKEEIKKDMIVVASEGKGSSIKLVKRVAGVPGDKIEYIYGHLFVNEKYITGPDNGISKSDVKKMYKELKNTGKIKKDLGTEQVQYENTNNITTFNPINLKDNEYWLVSDNMEINTVDSRTIGPVNRNSILGEVKTSIFN